MSKELTESVSPEIVSSILLTGDISKLSPTQKSIYYNGICKTLGLNPLTQPFAIIKFQGKEILYAKAGCTQQLADVRGINTEVTKRERLESVYIVTVRATMSDGRFTDEDGAVSLMEPDNIKKGDNWVTNPKAGKNITGDTLANAMMKTVTKAKRRAVLALCGLGMPDETEIETMERHPAAEDLAKIDPKKSRLENILDAQIEPEKASEQEIEKPKEEKPAKEAKKVKKEDPKPEPQLAPEPVKSTGPEVKTVNGLIESMRQPQEIEGKGIKQVFVLGKKFYGTFDKVLAAEIIKLMDNRVLVKISFTERQGKDKILNDIVSVEPLAMEEATEEA